MTLPIPLTVRLSTGRAERHITADLHDLSFRTVVPGGFASARFTLSRPLTIQPDEIAYYGRVYIYDARTGRVVWEGRLEDPGRGAGGSGEVWDLAAVGPAAHAQDRTFPYIMVHTNVSDWQKAEYLTNDMRGGTVEVTDFGGIGIACRLPSNTDIPANARAAALYNGILEAGQELALISYNWDCGMTSAAFAQRCTTEDATVVYESDADTAGGGSTMVVGTNWTLGQASPRLAFQWDGAASTTGAHDGHWAFFKDVVLAAIRYTKAGSKITSGYTAANALVYADQVVADLLGRILNQYDGANAAIAATTYGMDQIAYDHGVTAAAVLDDMMLIEPTFFWAAWESNTAGKHRFEWREWPTTVTYEATVEDGYTSSGSSEGLFNEVRVSYEAPNTLIVTRKRTQTVPELTAAGLTRTGHIALGKEIGSNANAIRVGDQFLADHLTPSNHGQLTVARPVYDHDRGAMVQPWEIRPGKLIRVRGILANSNALNATSRDGVTIFKVIAVDYDASSAAATLELDSQPLTLTHLLARMEHRPGIRTGRRTSRTV
jgi:hypothetical protein